MAVKPFSWITDGRSPVTCLLLIIFLVFFMGTLLFYIFLLTGSIIFSIEIKSFLSLLQTGELTDVRITRFIQVSQQLSFFFFPSFLFLILYRDIEPRIKLIRKNVGLFEILMVFILAFLATSVTTWTGIINSRLVLPHALSGLEEWLKEKEVRASEITNLLIKSPDGYTYMLNLLVMALVPAVSEEIMFRGVIQQVFKRIFSSVHWAVWITAIIFSAIHIQFYGFIPRLILGLIFGYLFVWTGNIIVPVAAHFFNNTITVTFSFVYGIEIIPYRIAEEKTRVLTEIPFIQIIAGSMILYYFWRNHRKHLAAGGVSDI
ncbi:MAG: lysostaphin resistance A-like protein [Bacteroidales bacterium]